jgi:hypothetical protein
MPDPNAADVRDGVQLARGENAHHEADVACPGPLIRWRVYRKQYECKYKYSPLHD